MTQTPSQLAESPEAESPDAGRVEQIRDWFHYGTRRNVAVLVVAFAALYVAFGITAPNFLTAQNQWNMLRDASFIAIPACAGTFVIIAGEIDISIGPAVAFSGVVLTDLITWHHWPLGLAVLTVLALGTFFGASAGGLRAYLNVPSFIGTLALYTALRAAAELFSSATPILVTAPAWFGNLGTGSVGSFPEPAFFSIGSILLFGFMLRKTRFGRYVYAVGGNAAAARRTGISPARIRVAVLAISGFMAAATGILLAAFLGSGNSEAAQGLEFQVISAIVIGGTGLFGGRGSITGTLLGVGFIEVISNALVLLGVNPYANGIVQGGLILVAVLVTVYRRHQVLDA